MGLLDPHPSNNSLFGINIPDFGLTELASSVLNQGRTAQGGSNLLPGGQPTAQLPNNSGGYTPIQGPGLGWGGNTSNTNTTATNNNLNSNPTNQTTNYSNLNQPTNNTPSQPSAEDQARNQYFSYLDQAAGQLGQTKTDLENQVGALVSGSQSSINTAMNSALGDIGVSRQNVASNEATSIRDLEKNMRNQMTAGQRYLGSIPGASNSSASGMYNYALGKMGNQNRANLLKQANDLYTQLDQQQNKVKLAAQDQLAQLDTWKNSQLSSIAQYIKQQQGQIDMAKAQYIQSQLQQIDAQATQYKQMLQQWAMNNSTSLSQLQQTLNGFAQGNPTSINQPALNGAINFNGPSQNTGTNLFGTKKVTGYDQAGNPIYSQ